MFKCAVILLCLTLVGAAAEPAIFTEGQCSASFSKPPLERTETADTPAGKLTMLIAQQEVRPGFGVAVICCTYPPAILKDDPKAVLGRVRDGFKGTSATVQSEKEITFAATGAPGLEFVIDRGNGVQRVRAFLHQNRLYQVLVSVQQASDARSREADSFLDSFRMKP